MSFSLSLSLPSGGKYTLGGRHLAAATAVALVGVASLVGVTARVLARARHVPRASPALSTVDMPPVNINPTEVDLDDAAEDGWVMNERVMDGYAKQKGSVCAAAAVAGAWNAAHSQALDGHDGKPAHGLALCTRDILDLYEKALGKRKGRLYRTKKGTAKMSTWTIGNRNVMRAVRLAHTKVRNGDTPLRCEARVWLNTKDLDKNTLDCPRNNAAWEALKDALTLERVVLLFHTKNHYCLIGGYRETEDGVKEIRMARRGQNPSQIMSWEECVHIITHYKIYCIMRIEGYSENPQDNMPLSEGAQQPSNFEVQIVT